MTGCPQCADPDWRGAGCDVCTTVLQAELAAAGLPELSCRPEPRRLTRRAVTRCRDRRRP